jgi:ankyrin repeat protein
MSLFSKKPTLEEILKKQQQELDQSFFSNADTGNLEKALELYKQGANVNYQNDRNDTALHLSAARNNIETTKFLVETVGAKFDIKNSSGRIPEASAMRNSCTIVHDYLRETRIKQESQLQEKEKPTGWIKTADDEIAHIMFRENINYRLTEIFNFSSRTYVHITQNLETKAENKTLIVFDELGNKSFLLNALQELKNQGGTAEEESINGKHHLAKDRLGVNQ